jgi:hypothetical protein
MTPRGCLPESAICPQPFHVLGRHRCGNGDFEFFDRTTVVLQDAFGQAMEQRPGCGFPVARLLGLFHASTGRLLKLSSRPSSPTVALRCRRSIRPDKQLMCS